VRVIEKTRGVSDAYALCPAIKDPNYDFIVMNPV
jgi:hypothetical protein